MLIPIKMTNSIEITRKPMAVSAFGFPIRYPL